MPQYKNNRYRWNTVYLSSYSLVLRFLRNSNLRFSENFFLYPSCFNTSYLCRCRNRCNNLSYIIQRQIFLNSWWLVLLILLIVRLLISRKDFATHHHPQNTYHAWGIHTSFCIPIDGERIASPVNEKKVPTLQEKSRKAGEEISLFDRNVAHADNFDTLTSARCYKQAWS